MVFPTENSPPSSCKKTQLLKPYLTSSSIDGSEAPQNPSAPSPPACVSFSGWRFANKSFRSWVRKMAALHEPIWRKAGIFEAVMASTYRIHKNTDLVLGIAEKWCPETKTFVFPWGETTITLEDVMMLLGFSVLGSPVFETLDSSGEKIMAKLEKEWLNLKTYKVSFVTQVVWMERFMDSGDELEHVAFLVLWLSYFVFPTHFYHCYEAILPIAVHLSIGIRIALAPAVLAHLYAELGLLKDHIRAFSESPIRVKLDLTALFKLVQVWTWERFREIQPKPNPILKGEPRLGRWSDLKQRTSGAREILENSKIDSFEWRPYTKTLKNWDFPRFYPEKAMWVPVDPNLDDDFISFARCFKVSELVGFDSVQHYFPNRVATQFGMLQDVSCPVNQINLSKEAAWNDYNKPIDDLTLYIPSRSAIPTCLAQDLPGLVSHHRNFTEKEAFFDDYNKSLDGLKLYMPSRLDRCPFTARYQDDHYDEDDGNIDVSPKVLPLSQVVQKLGKRFSAKGRRSKMRRSVNKDKIDELVNSLVSSGWKMNNYKSVHMKTAREDGDASYMDEEDINMSIAQMIRPRKKYSNAEKKGGDGFETLGKRTRRYVAADTDDSGSCQKLASMNIEQRSEEDDETASKAQKTRRICDYFEVDVNGNIAEKRTMIDDEVCNGSIMQSIGRNETKKAECLLHEDGDKKRCNEKLYTEVKKEEEIDERLKQRKLAIKEIELNLEARIIEMEKTLAKIRNWKTRGNQTKSGVSA